MLGMIDFRGTQPMSVDQCVLQAYLQQLVGQPFLQFRFSYGDELSLHVGQPQDYSSPKITDLVKGSYVVGTRASHWYLRSSFPPLVIAGLDEDRSRLPGGFQPLSKPDLETSTLIRPGALISFANTVPIGGTGETVSGYGLSLVFSDGSSLLVVPDGVAEPGDGNDELADWEVFTPYHRYLRVGPGARWSYLPSRDVASSQPA